MKACTRISKLSLLDSSNIVQVEKAGFTHFCDMGRHVQVRVQPAARILNMRARRNHRVIH